MTKFHIKKISEINKDNLINFYKKAFDLQNSESYNYVWRYRLGYSDYEPLVLLNENEICGHAGLLPIDIKLNNQIKKAIWFTDFYINKDLRSKGYGKILTQEWMKLCPIKITVCNNLSLKVFKKLNWKFNNKFLRRLKIIDHLNMITSFIKKNDSLNYLDFDNTNFSIETINNKNISEVIKLTDESTKKNSSFLIRDELWFKWRILECPYRNQIYILKYKDNFIILRLKRKSKLNGLSIIFSTMDLTAETLNLIARWGKKNNFCYLTFIDKDDGLNKFLPMQKKINFAFHTSNNLELDELQNNINNLQYIDSDIDFL